MSCSDVRDVDSFVERVLVAGYFLLVHPRRKQVMVDVAASDNPTKVVCLLQITQKIQTFKKEGCFPSD